MQIHLKMRKYFTSKQMECKVTLVGEQTLERLNSLIWLGFTQQVYINFELIVGSMPWNMIMSGINLRKFEWLKLTNRSRLNLGCDTHYHHRRRVGYGHGRLNLTLLYLHTCVVVPSLVFHALLYFSFLVNIALLSHST